MKYTLSILLLISLAAHSQTAKVYWCLGAHYASTDQHQPEDFFDGDITTEGTPRKMLNIYGFNRQVNWLQHHFSMYSQCGVWFDLTGAADLTDTIHTFHVTGFRCYSKNAGSGLSIWFFNGNQFFRPSVKARAQVINDPHSFGVDAIATLTNSSSDGWVTYNLPVAMDMRWVRMLIQGDTSTQQISKWSEIQILGTYNSDTSAIVKRTVPTMPSQYAANITYGSKSGSNWFGGYGPHTRSYEKNARLFYPLAYGDASTSQAVPSSFTFPYAFADVNPTTIAATQADGINYTFTNHAGSGYTNAKGTDPLTGAPSVTPVDSLEGYSSNPANYRRLGLYLKQLALVGGTTPTGGTNLFSGTHANGQGLTPTIDMGNENEGHDAFNDLDEYTLMTTAYDGDESTILVSGSPVGIKNGDPNVIASMPALVDWDWRMINTIYFYAKMCRTDGKFPADKGQVHKYFDVTDLHYRGVQRDCDQQTGSTSASAEQAHLLERAATFFMNLFVTIPFDWSETGRSHWDAASLGCGYDQSSTPHHSGLTSNQVVAQLNLREQLLACFTQFKVRHQYSKAEQNGTSNRFGAMGEGDNEDGSDELTTHFAEWNVDASVFPRLKNYSPEVVIRNGDSTSYWILKFHKFATDSVCYVVGYGTNNGTSGTVVVPFPSLTQVEELVPSFTSETGTSTTVSVFGFSTSRTITELPKLYFGKEAAGTSYTIWNIYRK